MQERNVHIMSSKPLKTAVLVGTIVFGIFLVFWSMYIPPGRRLYQGENPELYSIAINSVLGATGSAFDSSPRNLAKTIIIDEDSYGRKMFFYSERKMISTYSLHISQTSDDEYVWFYPDYNFISTSEGNPYTKSTEEIRSFFLAEDIEKLKEKNDWNMKINLDKCVKVEIVREKAQGSLEKAQILPLFQKVLGHSSPSIIYFITDDYGRSMYLGSGRFLSNDGPGFDKRIVMLFNPDGSYDENKSYFELTDLFNYQKELKQFKELNNWNQPL